MTIAEHARIRVVKHHHACVMVEDETTRILVDPGQLAPAPSLEGMDAVLITHRHFDHFDPVVVARALEQAIPVWVPADALDELGPHALLSEAVPGATIAVGTFAIQVSGDRHAEVHPHIAGPQNRAYLISEAVFVTGDAHPVPPGPFTALVTPVDAPWLRASDLIRYTNDLAPHQVIGIHDGLLNSAGLDVARRSANSLLREGAAHINLPGHGESIEIGPRPHR